MSYRNVHPLHIMWQEGLTREHLLGVEAGVINILALAGVQPQIWVHLHKQRRQPGWYVVRGKPPNSEIYLTQHRSIDWNIVIAGSPANSKVSGHLNSLVLLDSLREHPTFTTEPRYEVVVVRKPLHYNSNSARRISGIARQGQGAVVSLSPHLNLLIPPEYGVEIIDTEKDKREYEFGLITRMITMHELGHVFGLFPGINKTDPTDEELWEAHCKNECVMWWQVNLDLYRKIAHRPFCPSCLAKLKQFFIEE